MRLVFISDTHNLCNDVSIPDGDVLVHSGDLTKRGSLEEISIAANWINSLPHKDKVVISGNHDFSFQKNHYLAKSLMSGIHYLQDSSIVINGIKFWGSPWQPYFYNWAFNLHRGEPIAEKWRLIPNDTDVLITHGPPYGIGDYVKYSGNVGCKDLYEIVIKVSPKIHCFGHIHEGYGLVEQNGIKFINAAICDINYKPTNVPIIVDL